MSGTSPDLSCREMVELVTDYLENALTKSERSRFEAHLDGCDGCTAYVDQMRTTISLAGRIDPDALDPRERDELLGAFRGWKA